MWKSCATCSYLRGLVSCAREDGWRSGGFKRTMVLAAAVSCAVMVEVVVVVVVGVGVGVAKEGLTEEEVASVGANKHAIEM